MARRDPSRTARFALTWHRRIGVAAAILVLIAAVTGVILNHVEDLSLAQRRVSAPWLMEWYGMGHRTEPVSFRAGEAWVSWADGAVYIDGLETGQRAEEIVGAVAGGGAIVVATPRAVLLFNARGEFVERVAGAGIKGTIEKLGNDAAGLVVVATSVSRYVADAELLTWSPTTEPAAWSKSETTPDALRRRLDQAVRGPGLPLDRVILDVHSGRILGWWGPYLMDIAALCLVVLAGTGLYNWLKGRRR